MKTILVTGAGGFLGQEIIRQLLVKEYIRIIAVSSQKEKLQIQYNRPQIVIIGNDDILKPEFNYHNIHVLINCAFPRGTDGAGMADGLLYITKTLEMAGNNVQAVINISSQSVYSQKRLIAADENTVPDLESKYAVGKYASELLTNSICKSLPHTNLRLASLIGNGLEKRFINKIIKNIISGEVIHIQGGQQRFAFLDVRDAAAAVINVALSNPDGWNEVYNVGPQKAYNLGEITRCIVESAKDFGIDVGSPIYEENCGWYNSDINSGIFYKQFGWKPCYKMEDTVRMIFEACLGGDPLSTNHNIR